MKLFYVFARIVPYGFEIVHIAVFSWIVQVNVNA